jgi:tetratricopeptide (TPR) repeat protein
VRGWIAPVVVAALAACAIAQADSAEDQAELLFEEGRVLLDQGQAARACVKFEAAIRLDPSGGGIMLNLGMCNEKLGKLKSALYWFRKAQQRATETNPPMPAHERVAKEHALALVGKVATVTIVFASEAQNDATVKIDGAPVSPDDYSHVEVDPGDHVLTADAPGLEARQSFKSESSGAQTLTITLAPTKAAIAKPAATAPEQHSRVALWLAIGGTASLALAGGLTYYEHGVYTRCTTDGALDTAKTGCTHPTDAYAAAVEANDAHHVARVYGTGLFAAGGVALAVAGYLYLSHREHATIAPAIARDHVGIALIGDL